METWARRAEATAARRGAEAVAEAAAEAAGAAARLRFVAEIAAATDEAAEACAVAEARGAEARVAALRVKKHERAVAAATQAAAEAVKRAGSAPGEAQPQEEAEAAAAAVTEAENALAGAAAQATEAQTLHAQAEQAAAAASAKADAVAAKVTAAAEAARAAAGHAVALDRIQSVAASGRPFRSTVPGVKAESTIAAESRVVPESRAAGAGRAEAQARADARAATGTLAEARRIAQARAADARAAAAHEARLAAEARAAAAEAQLSLVTPQGSQLLLQPPGGPAMPLGREVSEELQLLRAERQRRAIEEELRSVRERAVADVSRIKAEAEGAIAAARHEDEVKRRFARLEDQLASIRGGAPAPAPSSSTPSAAPSAVEDASLRGELQALVSEMRAARDAQAAQRAAAEQERASEAAAAAAAAARAIAVEAAAAATARAAAETARAAAQAASDARVRELEARLLQMEERIAVACEGTEAGFSETGEGSIHPGPLSTGDSLGTTTGHATHRRTHRPSSPPPRQRYTEGGLSRGTPPRPDSPEGRLLSLEENLRLAMVRSQDEMTAQRHARTPPRAPHPEAEAAAGAAAAEATKLGRAAAAAGRVGQDGPRALALERAMLGVQELLEDATLDAGAREILGRDIADFSRRAMAELAGPSVGRDGMPDKRVELEPPPVVEAGSAEEDTLRAGASHKPVPRSDKASEFEQMLARGDVDDRAKLEAAIAAFTDQEW
jgi:hypothetical protein